MLLKTEEETMIIELMENVKYEDKLNFYKLNHSSSFILQILELYSTLNNPKKWGIFLENVAENLLGLSPSINSEHDKIITIDDRKYKIEIKSSTKNKNLHFQYNSIRMNYDYDLILFQNIGFKEIKYFVISKKELKKIKYIWKNQKSMKKNMITMINFKLIEKYVYEIKEKKDLHKFIKLIFYQN